MINIKLISNSQENHGVMKPSLESVEEFRQIRSIPKNVGYSGYSAPNGLDGDKPTIYHYISFDYCGVRYYIDLLLDNEATIRDRAIDKVL